jgi:hypothetical protein
LSFCLSAKLTRSISTGISIRGPVTVAKAVPELIPNAEIVTAIHSPKLIPAAVNAREVDFA